MNVLKIKKTAILLLLLFSLPVLSQSTTGKVKTIDIINWTHTDYGFTDHPLMVAELQKRYIDIALDYAEQTKNNKQGERFTWTVESLGPFWEWWQETTPSRREKMLQCIKRGQIDVNSMPFNIHPMLNSAEVEKLTSWVSADVSSLLNSRIAIQNDVNGFPRSVASKLISKGVKYIWLGMNGRLPFNKPTACSWEMPDGEKIFLYCGYPYWEAYNWFHDRQWRRNSIEAIDLTSRWPREGEIFKSDEESVREAHRICLKKLAALEEKGYSYESLPITFSNQWRCDNDGPFLGIVDFVKKWNELGLKPVLNITTATCSMESLEKTTAKNTVKIKGEFGDWWAFGMTAMPRETATARNARYLLQAAKSPVFKDMAESQKNRVDEIERDLCTYYEHTFAANNSSRDIYSTKNQGNMNEAFRFVYKAYEYASWLLAQQTRSSVFGQQGGVYVINTQQKEYSGWCSVNKNSIRGIRNPKSLLAPSTGKRIKLYSENDAFSFWIDKLAPNSTHRFIVQETDTDPEVTSKNPQISVNAAGWPTSIQWDGMRLPLFSGEAPILYVNKFITGGWWGATAIPGDYYSAEAEITRVNDTPHSVTYSQKLNNERFVSAERILTVYKNERRANIKIIFDRKLHTEREQEVIYAEFPFHNIKREVTTTNGGMEFTPYSGNVPNTCKSFFVADSWVKFATEEGTWLWSSKTSPVFELGKQMFFLKGDINEPDNSYLLQSMLYNNAWGVNFPAEYSGKTVYEYDVFYTPEKIGKEQAQQISDTYIVRPVIIVNPDEKEDNSYNKWLNNY